jgi:putative mRNA 3-end processing factor
MNRRTNLGVRNNMARGSKPDQPVLPDLFPDEPKANRGCNPSGDQDVPGSFPDSPPGSRAGHAHPAEAPTAGQRQRHAPGRASADATPTLDREFPPYKTVEGARAERWLYPTPRGLYCEPAQAYIDPHLPANRAIITHGHADHARSGHTRVLTTHETRDIMKVRYGEGCAGSFQTLAYGEPVNLGGVRVTLLPAGHILGSAQVLLEHDGTRVVVSGDYKREADPTCTPFEPVPCDVFVTEATFALPVFRHESARAEADRLVRSMSEQPERMHLLGVYGLGKCQRMLAHVREAGYDGPVYLHGALQNLTAYYEERGFDFGDLRPVKGTKPADFEGSLTLCPPSAMNDRWARRFGDAVTCFASGWMRVRGRARQRGVELPLVVSDHVDWPALLETILATSAAEVWVTHGREDALVRQLALMGRTARALSLVGYDDEGE